MVPSGTRCGVNEVEDAASKLVAGTYQTVSISSTLRRSLRTLYGVPRAPEMYECVMSSLSAVSILNDTYLTFWPKLAPALFPLVLLAMMLS